MAKENKAQMVAVVNSAEFTSAIAKVKKAVNPNVISISLSEKRCWVGAESDKCKIKVYFKPESIKGEVKMGMLASISSMLDYDGKLQLSFNNKLAIKALEGKYRGNVSVAEYAPVEVVTKEMKEGASLALSSYTRDTLISMLDSLPLAPLTTEVKTLTTHITISKGKIAMWLGDAFIVGYAEHLSKKITETKQLTIPKQYEALIAAMFADEKDLQIFVEENAVVIWGKHIELVFPISLPQIELSMVEALRGAHERKPEVDIEVVDVAPLNDLISRINSVASSQGVMNVIADNGLAINVRDNDYGYGELEDAIDMKFKGKARIKINNYSFASALGCIKKACRLQMYDKQSEQSIRITSGSGDTVIEYYCATLGKAD